MIEVAVRLPNQKKNDVVAAEVQSKANVKHLGSSPKYHNEWYTLTHTSEVDVLGAL